MSNEEKKDFNKMLNDCKDMPKIQVITDEKSIQKYGGNKMYFAPPMNYDIIFEGTFIVSIVLTEVVKRILLISKIFDLKNISIFYQIIFTGVK